MNSTRDRTAYDDLAHRKSSPLPLCDRPGLKEHRRAAAARNAFSALTSSAASERILVFQCEVADDVGKCIGVVDHWKMAAPAHRHELGRRKCSPGVVDAFADGTVFAIDKLYRSRYCFKLRGMVAYRAHHGHHGFAARLVPIDVPALEISVRELAKSNFDLRKGLRRSGKHRLHERPHFSPGSSRPNGHLHQRQ